MARPNILVKVYGHIYPVTDKLFYAVHEVCRAGCMPAEDDAPPIVERSGDMVRISYEGMFFPLDAMLEILVPLLQAPMQGKLDYIDLEAWTLTRHSINGTHLHVTSAPLNNVMDYAGL